MKGVRMIESVWNAEKNKRTADEWNVCKDAGHCDEKTSFLGQQVPYEKPPYECEICWTMITYASKSVSFQIYFYKKKTPFFQITRINVQI